ncbi:MAG: hypothetical protein KDK63_00910, partial [Chlamydiia bacterium]|nr:hypothetical protein [Chlamydiia bacterium]
MENLPTSKTRPVLPLLYQAYLAVPPEKLRENLVFFEIEFNLLSNLTSHRNHWNILTEICPQNDVIALAKYIFAAIYQ